MAPGEARHQPTLVRVGVGGRRDRQPRVAHVVRPPAARRRRTQHAKDANPVRNKGEHEQQREARDRVEQKGRARGLGVDEKCKLTGAAEQVDEEGRGADELDRGLDALLERAGGRTSGVGGGCRRGRSRSGRGTVGSANTSPL